MSDTAAAFDYAGDRGIRIVSASLSSTAGDGGVAQAVARHPNTLYIVAAGNDGLSVGSQPRVAVRVAGGEHHLRRRDRGQRHAGELLELLARERGLARTRRSIESTYRWQSGELGYGMLSGTSMATPMVSAAAALVLARDPALTAAQVKAALIDNADRLPALAGKSVTGARLNAYAPSRRSLQTATATGRLTPTTPARTSRA